MFYAHTHTQSLPPHALPVKYTDIFAVALTVTKLTGFSCSYVASCTLMACFFSSALLAQVSWSLRNPFFMYYLRGYGFICLFCYCLFMSFAFLKNILMRVVCPFLVSGSKFHLHMLPYNASRSFCFTCDQCPFLSTCVIQPLYLLANQKLKTWLYYVNVVVKLVPLHGVV